MISTFQCPFKTLIDCPNYYTTCLNPVNSSIFGSIQVSLTVPYSLGVCGEAIRRA